MAIFKKIFGGGSKKSKSVNEMRGRTKRAVAPKDASETRIAARRAQNLKAANIRAALAAAPDLPIPNIARAIQAAEELIQQPTSPEKKDVIERALRLKGSERVVRETLSHPLRQYIGLAVLRGLMDEGGQQDGASNKR